MRRDCTRKTYSWGDDELQHLLQYLRIHSIPVEHYIRIAISRNDPTFIHESRNINIKFNSADLLN